MSKMLLYDNTVITEMQNSLGNYKNMTHARITSEMPTIVQIRVAGADYIWSALDSAEGYAAFGRVLKGVLHKLCQVIPNCIMGTYQWDTMTILVQSDKDDAWLCNSVGCIISKVVSVAASEFMFLWKKEVDYSDWFWYINLQSVGVEFEASVFNLSPAKIPTLFQLEEYLALRSALEHYCEECLNAEGHYVGMKKDPEVLLDKLKSNGLSWGAVPREFKCGVLCVPTVEQKYELQDIMEGVKHPLDILSNLFDDKQENRQDWRAVMFASFLKSC